MREMSVGVGEFSKIIATQTMGITQIMGYKKNGELNTMKLGGEGQGA